jgi:hypothetical protein
LYILSRVGVILDWVFDWMLDLLIHVVTMNIANIHTLQITTAHAKYFPACGVFTSRSLVTASNSGESSTAALKSSLHSLPHRTHSDVPIFFLVTHLHGPNRKHRFEEYIYCCMRIRYRGNVFTDPLPRNGSGMFAYLAVVA